MTALEIMAIRALPKHFVADGTQTVACNGVVFAINPAYAPIQWMGGRKWKTIKITHLAERPKPLDTTYHSDPRLFQ